MRKRAGCSHTSRQSVCCYVSIIIKRRQNELVAVIVKRGLGDNCQTSPHTQITQWTALIAKLTAKSSLKFVLILSSPSSEFWPVL